MGRFDCAVIFGVRIPQQSRVYALGRKIIYMQHARGSAKFVDWRLSRFHTLYLQSLRDIIRLDERF